MKARAAIGRFFLRIGQIKASQPKRDEHTLPLFPLALIMDAEGLLADDARRNLIEESDGREPE